MKVSFWCDILMMVCHSEERSGGDEILSPTIVVGFTFRHWAHCVICPSEITNSHAWFDDAAELPSLSTAHNKATSRIIVPKVIFSHQNESFCRRHHRISFFFGCAGHEITSFWICLSIAMMRFVIENDPFSAFHRNCQKVSKILFRSIYTKHSHFQSKSSHSVVCFSTH